MIKFIFSSLISTFIIVWICFLSPLAKHKQISDREYYEMAVEYDKEHDTDYHNQLSYDPGWYSDRE